MIKYNPLVLLLLCTFSHSYAQDTWELKKSEDDIEVYTRRVNDSKVKEYKAVSTINTSMDYILNELLTAPEYTDACEAGISYYVKQLSDNQHVFYVHQDLPWPVRDRDVVTLVTVNKLSDSKYKLTIEGLPEGVPEKKQMLRIKELMGYWLLEEKEANQIMVTQQMFLNPEGSLPAFV
ncbi:MAG: START domain-containing protein, partial [Bacteroidota bacterium]